jgi:NADPH-dependent 2,4-dienoyl-CoA reductase/sulfur reductase-like enzyme
MIAAPRRPPWRNIRHAARWPVMPGRATAPRLRVVIVGGGFGGLAYARALDGAPVEVLLIDRDNYHLFTPLLYQVASALLNPADIAYPLRKLFRRSRNIRFRQGAVTGVDFEAKVVRLHDGAQVRYDRLVLATGSTDTMTVRTTDPAESRLRHHHRSGQPPAIWRTLNGGKFKNWRMTLATRCSRVTSTAPTG